MTLTLFGHKTKHIPLNLPFARSLKSKDVEIVRAEIQLINSVLVFFKCLESVDKLRRGNAKALLSFNSCLDEKD